MTTYKKVTRIKNIENEFVEQLKAMLHDFFPEKIGFDIDYYLGEDTQGVKGLYIIVISKIFGNIYENVKYMKDYQIVTDVEQGFMNEVINDFVLAGITFLKVEALSNKGVNDLRKAIRAKDFVHMMPNVLISIN